MDKLVLEACVEALEESILAEKNGANRLELCSRLDLDGLTPEFDLTRQVLENVNIPVKVMIRPRGGNFVYNDEEFQQMKDEILSLKNLKISGVVFGILDQNNQLNITRIAELTKIATPLEVTIHKAIDSTPDLVNAVLKLRHISTITSILTSGGKHTAKEGSDMLRKMMFTAGNAIKIIPAGRITKQNISEIHQLIGAREYHGRRIVGELK